MNYNIYIKKRIYMSISPACELYYTLLNLLRILVDT